MRRASGGVLSSHRKSCFSSKMFIWPNQIVLPRRKRLLFCSLANAEFLAVFLVPSALGRVRPPAPASRGAWAVARAPTLPTGGAGEGAGAGGAPWLLGGGGTMTTGLLRDAAAPGSPVLASPQNPSPIPEGQPGPHCLLAQSAGHHQAGSVPVNVSSAGWKTRWEPPRRRRGRTRGRRRGEGGLCANKIRAGGVWRGRGR